MSAHNPAGHFDHAFDTVIERHHMGGELYYTVVFVPDPLAAALPSGGPLRVEGELAEMPVEGALMPVRGRRYLLVPAALMRERGLAVGDAVEVRLSLADPDVVDVPPDLRLALHAEEALAEVWDALTVGRRRGLAYRVASAKREATRAKRVDEIVTALREGRDPTARR